MYPGWVQVRCKNTNRKYKEFRQTYETIAVSQTSRRVHNTIRLFLNKARSSADADKPARRV